MRHNQMAMRGLVTWTKKYAYGGHWVGYLNVDPDFIVTLEQTPGTTEWNLKIEKDWDVYYLQYPRRKSDVPYLIEDWIDRGMKMEYEEW